MQGMKFVYCPLVMWAVPSAFAVFAGTFVVPPQPAPEFADTEVSTNVAMSVNRIDTREMLLRLQLEGTPTNALEVAFGRDANEDGSLDAEETETVYGWRGGRYFVENVRAGERIETETAENAQHGIIDIQVKNDSAFVPMRFSAVCGGETAFAGLAAEPPPWLFRESWNLVRVTRRGGGVPSGWVQCEFRRKGFFMGIR